MKIFFRKLFNRKVLFVELIGFLIGLVALTSIQYAIINKYWDITWLNYFSNIITALMTGIAVGIFFELFVRKEQSKELLELVDLKENLRKAGITKYFNDFRNVDLKNYLETAKNIDMYFSYGRTLISQLYPVLEKKFMDKEAKINIFFLTENNPFLTGLGNLWGKYSDRYNTENIKEKINEVRNGLLELIQNVKKKGKDKIASVNIYGLKYHHISYSFYRFDDTIIFNPTKLTEDKNFRPISLICNDTNNDDLYRWCMSELDYIKKQQDALEIIIQT